MQKGGGLMKSKTNLIRCVSQEKYDKLKADHEELLDKIQNNLIKFGDTEKIEHLHNITELILEARR
jgi:spermidine/putrescine-binding protein